MYVYLCLRVSMRECVVVYEDMCMFMWICVYACVYVCMCMHAYVCIVYM